ncbi:MAG TPA: SPOR domain-containing protein [Candidatus Binatia bacterium]|jgi:cell division septation protein DedD
MASGGERDSRRFRFDLSRLELAGLVVSTAASLFIVFLLGLWAGRGLGDRRLDEPERIVRVPVAPMAAEETPGSDQDLTFDDKLSDGEHPARADEGAARAAAHPAAEPAIVPAPPPPVAVAAAREPAAHAPVEHLDEPAHVAAANPPAPHAPAAAAAPQAQHPSAPVPATAPKDATVAVAIAKSGPAAPPPASGLPSSVAGGEWSVQVSATRDPHTADDVLKRLKGKGYDAYIVKARREGAMFYRVRVGHYASMEHASQMVSRLRREPGVPEAFVASD